MKKFYLCFIDLPSKDRRKVLIPCSQLKTMISKFLGMGTTITVVSIVELPVLKNLE